MKVDKEKEVLRDQLADVQKRVGKGEAEEARFKAEVFTLNMIINEADAERLKQQKEYETVLSELTGYCHPPQALTTPCPTTGTRPSSPSATCSAPS